MKAFFYSMRLALLGGLAACGLTGCLALGGHHSAAYEQYGVEGHDFDWAYYEGRQGVWYTTPYGDRKFHAVKKKKRGRGGVAPFPFPKEAHPDEPKVHGLPQSEWEALTPHQQREIARQDKHAHHGHQVLPEPHGQARNLAQLDPRHVQQEDLKHHSEGV